MRQFSARASTPRGSREKQPRYHLRCSRSVASATIRINPITSRVMAASSSANAVPRQMSALGHKWTCAVHQPMSALVPKATAKADSCRINSICPASDEYQVRETVENQSFLGETNYSVQKIQLELALAAIEQFELRSTLKWREHLASRFANATLNRRRGV